MNKTTGIGIGIGIVAIISAIVWIISEQGIGLSFEMLEP